MKLPLSWRRRGIRGTAVLAVCYATALAGAWVAGLAASLPSNIVWERTQWPQIRAELNTVAAQNFAFFTRLPQTDQIGAYRSRPDGTIGESLLITPQGRVGNLLGLSRDQRAQGPELASLVRSINDDDWIDCTGLGSDACIDAASELHDVQLSNDSRVPTLCGGVVLTIETTVKWAYRKLAEDGHTIDRMSVVHITCHRMGTTT